MKLFVFVLFVSLWCSSLRAQEDREAVRKTYENVRKSFVALEVKLRKKTKIEKAEAEDEAADAESQRLQQLMETDQPLETWAVAVEKDLLLMAEKGLKEADIGKIEFDARVEGRTMTMVIAPK